MRAISMAMLLVMGAMGAAAAQTPSEGGLDAAVSEPLGVGPYAPFDLEPAVVRSQKRALVVFADDATDAAFQRQMAFLKEDLAGLAERDVVVVVDTDPAAASPWRTRLRPRGFSLVLLDKDLMPVFRKPAPWQLRETLRAIDRLPSRRQEISENGSGAR